MVSCGREPWCLDVVRVKSNLLILRLSFPTNSMSGRGYDVLLLASFGYNAFGLEVSETAVKRCLEEQDIHSANYPVRDKAVGAGKAEFICNDFFSNTWTNQIGVDKFDLIYDYTVSVSL